MLNLPLADQFLLKIGKDQTEYFYSKTSGVTRW